MVIYLNYTITTYSTYINNTKPINTYPKTKQLFLLSSLDPTLSTATSTLSIGQVITKPPINLWLILLWKYSEALSMVSKWQALISVDLMAILILPYVPDGTNQAVYILSVEIIMPSIKLIKTLLLQVISPLQQLKRTLS